MSYEGELVVTHYEDDEIKEVFYQVDEKRHGPYWSYYPGFRKKSEQHWIHGIPDGIWFEWYMNGQEKARKNYELGKRIRTWYEYGPYGDELYRCEYS